MTTRMIHPLHGATHAYDAGEIAKLQGWGWAVELPPPDEPDDPAIEPAIVPVVRKVVEVVDEPEKRKPGRPRKGE